MDGTRIAFSNLLNAEKVGDVMRYRIRQGLVPFWLALIAVPAVLHPVTVSADSRSAEPRMVKYNPNPVTGTSPAALAHGSALVLSAPPRDSAEQGQQIFGPIAEYLSRVLGRPVVYRYSATWGGYQADMQRGAYDIVFDGPHFVSWRIQKAGHNALVKLPGEFVYTAVVRKENTRATQLKDMSGHTVCAHAPPNLGTLVLLNVFDNPLRQPVIVTHDGYKEIYDGLMKGSCEIAMLPLPYLEKIEHGERRTRIVFRTTAMPQQAFSAGPHVNAVEQQKIVSALLSPAAALALVEFRKVYGTGRNLEPANNNEYANLAVYLRDQWGF